MANTEVVTRKVVILGFPGVQALDVVGPFDVFTGASLLLDGEYDVALCALNGEPATTGTGLAFMTTPLPDPDSGIDTVVLPGGGGVDATRGKTPNSSPG